MIDKVLFLGASGMVGAHLVPGLESHYTLRLTDLFGTSSVRDVLACDVTSYEDVCAAASGVDAILNFTVVRNHREQSFHVNTRGSLNVMKAAVCHGIRKVVQSGPQYVRRTYDHDFDVTDVPPVYGADYYCLSKGLGSEICRSYARAFGIHTVSFVFNGLGSCPSGPVAGDVPPFTVVWEDLLQACRLALEVESIPDYFQEFNLLSWEAHGKYNVDKARRLLGFETSVQDRNYFSRRS